MLVHRTFLYKNCVRHTLAGTRVGWLGPELTSQHWSTIGKMEPPVTNSDSSKILLELHAGTWTASINESCPTTFVASVTSLNAYEAVVYLLVETPLGRQVRITASKTHVSLLKTQTISRLELLAALLLAQLMDS